MTMDLQGILLFGPRMKWLCDELQKRDIKTRLLWSEKDYAPIIDTLREWTGPIPLSC